MSKKYLGRINELIRRKLTILLLEESNDPRFSELTITAVKVNRDTTRAEIYYSLIGSPEERVAVQSALDGAAGWFRTQLAPTLRVRNIPQLIFIYDPSLEYGAHMDTILEKLHEENADADIRGDDESNSVE
ncbi:MAG: 30S ribosome-binding factor RbfA [Anaerolineae bacterium]|nr:30S ribosome-binding factor RbfA [Anaerolineae bacterium]